MKKIDIIMNTIIGAFIGAFIGLSTFRIVDYINHPDIYEMASSPWYTSILIYGIATLIIVAIAVIIKVIIKKNT